MWLCVCISNRPQPGLSWATEGSFQLTPNSLSRLVSSEGSSQLQQGLGNILMSPLLVPVAGWELGTVSQLIQLPQKRIIFLILFASSSPLQAATAP